ncbi:hypothetical protein [Legionella sp. CNM-4043-24]|uniref:hypothetical protein n=1 Tax=Legionella sp. CNM-4043-24 TaxID=3421646 RepID=UPI00403B310C
MSDLVLWGHHLDDYLEMFDLSPDDLKGNILEFGSGPSAFQTEAGGQGISCVSCDPLFALDEATLHSKAVLVFADRAERVRCKATEFDFSRYAGFDGFLAWRQAGMDAFFADYAAGKKEKRYQAIRDLHLPFADFTFDLALSSHYLFGELDNQDLDFHVQMIRELARVAREVRIFPLGDFNGQMSALTGPVLLALQQENYGVEVRSIRYHLQAKGNAMLRVWAQECRI